MARVVMVTIFRGLVFTTCRLQASTVSVEIPPMCKSFLWLQRILSKYSTIIMP